MSVQQHEVIVVGGGPVGAAAALALHQHGFDVALVERAHSPAAFDPAQYDLRVYAVSPPSAQWLSELGVWGTILQQRACAYRAMRVWERDPASGLRFESGDIGAAQLGWIVEHGLIVAALWEACAAAALPIYTGATIRTACFPEPHLSQSDVHLELDDGRQLSAQLCVAADGADSQLRKLAGIDVTGWRYGERAIVCHLHTAQPHRGIAWQRFLKTGPLAFLPLADGRCSIVWSAEDRTAESLLSLDDGAFCQRLTAVSEGVLGNISDPTPRVAFPLRLQHAQEYSRPGIVLVGDAAHAIHPLAGQGVNLGFGDAHALVDTLVNARGAGRDWAGERNLARYTRARKATNLEMLAVTDALDKAFRAPLPGIRPLLGLGLGLVDRLGPLRTLLAQQAASS
jgi:2-octaprenylphenol hydroxylase